MKKILCILNTSFLILFCGCSSTTITETTYDKDGTVVSQKITETSESPIVVAVGNTKDKHVLAHIGGWYANIGVQPNSNSYGLGAGSIDNTYASIVASDGTKDGAKVAKQFIGIVDSSKYSLSVSQDGLTSEKENEVQKNSNGSTEAKTTESEAK